MAIDGGASKTPAMANQHVAMTPKATRREIRTLEN
jgi:hypothetical protein